MARVKKIEINPWGGFDTEDLEPDQLRDLEEACESCQANGEKVVEIRWYKTKPYSVYTVPMSEFYDNSTICNSCGNPGYPNCRSSCDRIADYS